MPKTPDSPPIVNLEPTPPSWSVGVRKNEKATANALAGLFAIALTTFVVGTLYVASDILIPLTLSALLAFLLSPLAGRLERFLGRLTAVIVVGVLIFLFVGSVGWVLSRQVKDLGTRLPDYKTNIENKLHSLQLPKGGSVKRLSEMFVELESEMLGAATVADPAASGDNAPAVHKPVDPTAVPVRIIEAPRSAPVEQVRWISRPLFGVLGTSGIVLVLMVFMLLERESLRGKIIRLIGQSNVSATSLAIEDAGRRVSRYLTTQFVVNLAFGTLVATGLYLIGVPNATLWGALSGILRFIPYVGTWIAAVFPTILALAVSPGWSMVLLTLGLFGTLELVTANLLEPLLYRSSTGISSVALLVAALFWTWLWGPVGLLLSTPLTVWLVVLGRHAPKLAFFSIMLGDEEARQPAEECYHRLLTQGLTEAAEVAENYLKANSITALYDRVLIPAVTAAEIDFRRQAIDESQRETVLQGIRDMIVELECRPPPGPRVATEGPVETEVVAEAEFPGSRVLCLPARGVRDEIAGLMLTHLLRIQGVEAENGEMELVAGDLPKIAPNRSIDAIFISVIPPSTVIHARSLCAKIRALFPRVRIIVGIWGAADKIEEAIQGLRARGADQVVVSLADAIKQVQPAEPEKSPSEGVEPMLS